VCGIGTYEQVRSAREGFGLWWPQRRRTLGHDGEFGDDSRNAPALEPALSVQGVATFRRSGLFIVPLHMEVAIFDVPGGLTASSGAVAMTADRNGYLVARAIPDPATGTLTLHMGGSKPVPTKVAWFVFG